jgi:hypothetical protein
MALMLSALVTACAPSAPAATVAFVEPQSGATVSSPVLVKMAAENFTVEPAGEVKAGAGHLHIIVDQDCVAAGQVITKDDVHLHYGQGQLEAQLELTPGQHTLCLQAADGAHVALAGAGMTQKITVTVK